MSDHPLSTDVYKASLGEEVELFMVDWSEISGDPASVAYFCSSAQSTVAVKWKNKAGTAWVDYVPVPITAEGFEAKSDGTLPRPKLSISNVEATAGAMAGPLFTLVYTYQDLLGAKVTRYKTLGKYLYGGSSPNYNAHYPEDVYQFNQKLNHNPKFIEWELAPDFDAQGTMLPRRLILRDMCQLRYRRWDSVNSVFIYDNTENACPIVNRGIITADPDFSTITGWTLGDYWAWNEAAQKVTKTPHAESETLLGTTRALGGKNYEIGVTVEDYTAGHCHVYFGGVTPVYELSGNGLHTFGAYCSADNAPLSFSAHADFAGSITLVTVEFYADAQDEDDGTSASEDVCSHTLAGCQIRWPGTALPFSGFPGVGRVRV